MNKRKRLDELESDSYEYGKTNLLQSLENARTFASYIGGPCDELRGKLEDAITFFTESVTLIMEKYELQSQNRD